MKNFFSQARFFEVSLAALLALSGVSMIAQADSLHGVAPKPSDEQAKELKDVDISENLGSNLDLSLKFKDETGKEVSLSSFYDGTHPVVISLVYFSCPGLCNFHLNGAIETLKKVDWSVGNQFQYLAISFDGKETPDLAAQKKVNYMKVYDRAGTENGWHFLTADEATLKAITAQIGFKYKWVEETKEWAHASAAVVTTPSGKISRYLHGIMFDNKTFKLALNEASEGKVGTFVDKMIWYCFHYDPKLSKYTLYASRVMKLGGVAIIFVLMAMVLPIWIRSRKKTVKL